MNRNLRKSLLCLTLLASLGAGPLAVRAGEGAAPKKLAEPTVEQRLEDLEAYINNAGRQADTDTNHVSSKLGSVNDKGDKFTANPGPGYNAWQMTSTALVLFMTLPGLALFYGGLVRRKNVLSVVAQCFFITGLVTILWWACGYSLSFSTGGPLAPVLGNLDFKFFNGVDSSPNNNYSPWVSHNVYAIYQLMFAIITPALIIGAIAERMKFSAICLFMTLRTSC